MATVGTGATKDPYYGATGTTGAAAPAAPAAGYGTGGYGTTARGTSSSYNILLYFVAIFIPTLPVFMKTGCSMEVFINILLWILGWIPGVIHAWWIISRTERAAVVY